MRFWPVHRYIYIYISFGLLFILQASMTEPVTLEFELIVYILLTSYIHTYIYNQDNFNLIQRTKIVMQDQQFHLNVFVELNHATNIEYSRDFDLFVFFSLSLSLSQRLERIKRTLLWLFFLVVEKIRFTLVEKKAKLICRMTQK